MRAKWVAMLVLIGVACLLIAPVSSIAQSERDEVNKFYKSAVEIIRKPAHMKELIELTAKNPAVAQRCIAVCGQKVSDPGKQGEVLRTIHDQLKAAVILASKITCDEQSVLQVAEALAEQDDYDESIFFLNGIITSCPRAGKAYQALGDVYLQNNQCGMAIVQYKKAVQILRDEDSRNLLEEARKREKKLLAQALTEEDIDKTMAPTKQKVPKAGGKDVEIENAVQILFDEWSSEIKGSFRTNLEVLGRWAQQRLPSNPGSRLMIEGHSDRRGDLARNMQVSEERAKSVKAFLVQNYGINPAQVVTEGFGPNRPYSPEENETGWSLNRRVEFKKLSESSRPE